MAYTKRARSSSMSPPLKRARHDDPSVHGVSLTSRHPSIPGSGGSIRDIVASHEIFLNVLGFLSAEDLASVEGVNREWKNMAVDSSLWRSLYLARYPGTYSRSLATDLVTSALQETAYSPATNIKCSETALVDADSLGGLIDHDAAEASNKGNSNVAKLDSASRNEEPPSRPSVEPSFASIRDSLTPVPLSHHGSKHDTTDWKMLYKIGSNWSNGNASVQSLSPTSTPRARSRPPPSSPSPTISHAFDSSQLQLTHSADHIIALSPDFIFTAEPSSPLLQVHLSSSSPALLTNNAELGDLHVPVALIPPPPGWSSPSHPEMITSIAVDGYQPTQYGRRRNPVRLALFYRSGGYAIIQLQLRSSNLSADVPSSTHSSVNWVRLSTFAPPSHRRRSRRRHIPDPSDHVTLSTFFWPVLVSCTNRFFLSIYRMTENGPPTLLQTMHSAVSCHPATLSVLPVVPVVDTTMTEDTWSVRGEEDSSTDLHYRATLAYSSPLYPQSWTVAVQEMEISIPLSPSSTEHGEVESGECWQVARKVWHGGWSERRWPFRAKGEVVGVKGGQAAAIGVDERWCVLAGEGGEIQVYALPTGENARPSKLSHFGPSERSPPRIHHSQTLLAHSAAVTSLSLSHGRCVSASRDGRVLVWELDESVAAGEAVEREEEEMMGRLREVAEGKRNAKFVEVKDVGSPRKEGKGMTTPSLEESTSIATDPQSSTQALRLQVLPRPPAPHPLSVAGIVREYNLNAPAEGSRSSISSTNAHSSSIRNITFNQDTIAGLVEIIEEDMISDNGSTSESLETGVSPPMSARGSLRHRFVRIWKFDV